MSPLNFHKRMETWNRKFHIYFGFYLLLFIWLFSISGIIKNHPKWSFAEFWSKREQTSRQQTVQIPTAASDAAKAKDIMRQLDISGEITSTESRPAEERFDFRIVGPGKIIDVKTDLREKNATVEQTKVNGWGVINMLHNFTGVNINDPEQKRDWFITRLWSFFMDAASVGFIALAVSGVWLWLYQKRTRRIGIFALALGILVCGFFIFGLG